MNDSGAVYVWQPETIWGEYCAPEFPNSSAQFGHLLWVGSPGVSDADFTLAATSLPSGQFGLFLSAREAAWIPLGPPGLNLCLGGPQGYGRLMQTLGTTGTGGYLISQVSLSQLATAQGPTAAQPGETWYFQAWCRDGSASHLTSALAIQFQ
ncbi:MAG: hypothetical protein R3E96_06480 [Planctomycetota bacterium]